VLVFVVLLTLVSLVGITRLKFDDDITKLFLNQKVEVSDLEGIRTRTERAVLIVLEADDLFSPDTFAVIHHIDEELRQLEGVAGAVSLCDLRSPKRVGQRRLFTRVLPQPDADANSIRTAGERALVHPMSREQLFSKDGKSTLIMLDIEPESLATKNLVPLLDSIKKVLNSHTRNSSVKALLTGFPVLRVEIAKSTIRDEFTFNTLGCLVAILIASVTFRRPASVVIVLAGALASVIWTFGCLGLFAGEEINPVNAIIAPLALAIGMATSVHLLMHIREKRDEGADRLQAVVSSLRTVGLASALSSLTTVIGFASLGAAELPGLAHFGIGSAVAVALTFVAVLTVVPLLASSSLGNHIQVADQRPRTAPIRTKWHTHLAAYIVDHRVAALTVSLLSIITALYLGLHARSDPRLANALPSFGKTHHDFALVEQEFTGALPLVATVSWSASTPVEPEDVYEAIADAHHVLEGRPIISPPLSLVNLYQSMPEKDRNPESLFEQLSVIPDELRAPFYDEDAGRALLVARCRDAGGGPIDELLTSIESEYAQLAKKHAGFQFGVAPTVIHQIRNANSVVKDLMKSMMMSVPLTIGVIMLALKSVRAGLLALPPNIFPMVALAATMVIFGQPITLTGAAVFVMCFGIAVDDTIHEIIGFNRRRAAGHSVRESIVEMIRELGDAVVSTSVILIGGLGVVIFGQAYATRAFGVMFSVGLLYALVGDLIITPAMLACFPGPVRPKTAEPEL
jgi:predicted RND superfamily exporter protein